MYLDYFSLDKFPFRITPDPTLFFPGGADGRGVVLEALVYAITSGEGILKVVGEVGSGKTMLCRMLGNKLSDSVEIVYLANPNLSARDIIFAISFELELDVDSNTDRLLAMHKLQEYLLKKHSEGGTVVVFIEEAQGMPLEALEEIRLLSNLETHQHKLMQIVLFGQPELDVKLEKKSIRQLNERITHSFYLEPLSVDVTGDYINHRLRAAGCPWPQLFSEKAEKKLAKAASGLTRRINILADKALMSAYADSSTRKEPRSSAGEIQSMVLVRHVEAAIKDSAYGYKYAPLLRYSGVGLAALLVFGAGAFFILKNDYLSPGSNEQEQIRSVVVSASGAPLINSSVILDDSLQGTVQSVETPVLLADEFEEVSPDLRNSAMDADSLGELVLNDRVQVESLQNTESLNGSDDSSIANVEEKPEVVVLLEAAQVVESEPEADIEIALVEEVVESSQAPVKDSLLTESSSSIVDESVIMDDFAEGAGLVDLRARAGQRWLQNLSEESSYTLQLISVSKNNRESLEEFLQFFSVTGLLDSTYACAISATANAPEQYLIFHGNFDGVTDAREYLNNLPIHLKRYTPYIRNTSDIACRYDVD